MKIAYNDGLKLKLYSDGVEREKESDYITNYFAVTQKSNDSVEWKKSGYGAAFRGEVQTRESEKIEAFVNAAIPLGDDNVLYSFTVNNMSGLYKKDFAREKDSESHIVHSNTTEFLGLDYNEQTDRAVACIKTDAICANLAVVDLKTNDYRTVTGGDSKDCNPAYSLCKPHTVLFDTQSVGRDYQGDFIRYAPAQIASLDLDTMQIRELHGDEKYSYISPKDDTNGNLYCIRRPVKEKKKRNLLLDILLIPWRILQAIYYFLESFVLMFTGKTFTEKSKNPTKGRERNSQQILIDGNLINADKEFKRNQKNKDKLTGFIPSSWQLVKITDGEPEVLKKGIAAFDVLPDGSIVCCNGKHVLRLHNGETEKIATGGMIVKVAAGEKVHPASPADNLFDL